jgi:NhaP-type Na+/H+ or K+/H+ antiporter
MDHHVLVGLASLVVLGIASQWLAWRLRLPSILVLLLVGFIAGPVTGFLHPDELLGDLIAPVVSISVGLILFEGGLSLKLPELREIGNVVRNLITIGAFLTWVLGSAGAYFILQLDFSMSILLGSILVVTGPTVIIPLLRDIRPTGQVGKILRWEGILIDPVGVTLAVLVFEGIVLADLQMATAQVVTGFITTIMIGLVIGVPLALILTMLLRRYWIPDYLQNAVTVMVVVGAFAVSDLLQAESGLLTVTIMGIVMANQKATPVKHIIEFKENLGVMLISNLFILLAARLHLDDLVHIGLETIAFVAFLILIVRPAVVFVSTLGSELDWRSRVFVAWLAPRGIVAAASASIFALELSAIGHPQAELLTPLTFTVIVTTVAVYGLTAGPVARRLGVAEEKAQGVLILGAHPWALELAASIKNVGFRVMLADSNWENIAAARMRGFETHYGDILREDPDDLELSGIGRILALTSNDEINSLAALQFIEIFGRSEVYQISSVRPDRSGSVPDHLRGRLLFDEGISYANMVRYFERGAQLKTVSLTQEFTYEMFRSVYSDSAILLFMVDDQGGLNVFATDQPPMPRPGQSIIALVNTAASPEHVVISAEAKPAPA